MKIAVAFAPLLVVACSGSSPVDVPSPSGTSTTTSPTEPPAPTSESPKTSAGESDAPPTPPAAMGGAPDCAAYASAYCTKANACGHLSATLFGAACASRMTSICEAHVAAPGSGLTPTALAACTSAFASASASCDLEPAECAFKGTLASNDACAFDDQCATGACGATSTACGKCVVATKTTTPKSAGLGETCDDSAKSAPACNGPLGLTCDSKTRTCVEIPTAAIGEPCGWFGMIVMCETGGTCKPGASGSGTCIAEKGIGDACSASAGYPECAFGAACMSGTCAYPTAAGLCK